MRKIFAVLVMILVCVICIFSVDAFAAMSDRDFLRLCIVGSTREIEEAIKYGANVNASEQTGWTALMVAAENNSNPEVISVLLENGANVNARDELLGGTALIFAALKNTNPEIISRLLENGADASIKDKTGKSAIDYASNNTNLKNTASKGWWGNFWENNKLWDNKKVAEGVSEWWNDEDFWENNKEVIIAAGVSAVTVAATLYYYYVTGEAPPEGEKPADYFEWLRGSDEVDTPLNWDWYNTPDNKRYQWLKAG